MRFGSELHPLAGSGERGDRWLGGRLHPVRVDADPELAGLLITGVGDVFIPGGDLGQKVDDKWADFNAAPGAFDVLPFDILRQSVFG